MNIYVVTEGVGETKVYRYWIRLVNPSLEYVDHIEHISQNNYSIISGCGYPLYLQEVIENAIQDVNNHNNINRLVIAVDSEDMTLSDKYNEISNYISGFHCIAEYRIIIQHFCLETWALGNQKIIRDHPQNETLIKYKQFFNVKYRDPEDLPPYNDLNRAQFALKYLKKALNDKYRNLGYIKGNPKVLLNDKYFSRVKERNTKQKHIQSFNAFLSAFI